MERKQFGKYGKFDKRGNFEKKERKETHIGGLDWYFRSMELADQYQNSNNWKFLSIQEYEDNFRTAKAVLKALYKKQDDLKIGWNIACVFVDHKEEGDICVGFGVYKSKEGKLGIPLYNSVISGKFRHVGLSNVIYGLNLLEEGKHRRTYFKHFEADSLKINEVPNPQPLWDFYEKEEKIDGFRYFGNQKFTLIFMSEDFVNNKSSITHKKSTKKDIKYEKPVKKFNNDRKGGFNKGFRKDGANKDFKKTYQPRGNYKSTKID